MRRVNMHEAKTHFSKLVDAVCQGNEIVIAMAGKRVARLCPLEKTRKRRIGVLKGKLKIADDFDSPLPNAFLDDFES